VPSGFITGKEMSARRDMVLKITTGSKELDKLIGGNFFFNFLKKRVYNSGKNSDKNDEKVMIKNGKKIMIKINILSI